MLIIYVIYAGITVGSAVVAYVALRKCGQILALTIAFAVAITCGLFFPMPIHGGFTIVLEELIANYRNNQRLKQDQDKEVEESRFMETLRERFVDSLPYVEKEQVSENWIFIETETGTEAWLDVKSGLIWSKALPWNRSSRPTFEEAKSFCRNFEPPGYWALPTAGERFLFWQNGGETVSPSGSLGTLSVLVDTRFQMEMPQTDLGNGRGFYLRCVARSGNAPLHGYTKDDIPLDEWNQYQIEKIAGN